MVGQRPASQGELFVYLPEAPATEAREKLRAIAELLDFGPIRELVAPYFAVGGKPSVDPVIIAKMLFLGALFGIRSRRELCEQCADRLSFREFLGLGWDERPPVHSNFCNWAQRLGPQVFRDLLHVMVRQCATLGVEFSAVRSVDATFVRAQAAEDGPTVAVERSALAAYVDALLAGDPAAAAAVAGDPKQRPEDPVKVNRHDPEARWQRIRPHPAEFGYSASFSTDPGSGLITDVVVRGLESAETLAEHILADPLGNVREVVADSTYDRGEALALAQSAGVTCYVPEKSTRLRQIPKVVFWWDAQANVYYCPEGRVLRWKGGPNAAGETQYRAHPTACDACRRKHWCTTAPARTITRCAGEEARERCVRGGYQFALRMAQRRTAEHLNLLAKRDHGLRRAQGRRRVTVSIQAVFVALAINANKLLRYAWDHPRQAAAGRLREATAAIQPRIRAIWRRCGGRLGRRGGCRSGASGRVWGLG